jgi:putative peptidoglycan lipid II flippase
MAGEARWLTYHFAERALHLSGLVAGGVLIYFATLGLLGFRPADFKRRAAE